MSTEPENKLYNLEIRMTKTEQPTRLPEQHYVAIGSNNLSLDNTIKMQQEAAPKLIEAVMGWLAKDEA